MRPPGRSPERPGAVAANTGAAAHHHQRLGHVAHHCQVVAHQHEGQRPLTSKPLQQVQDLRLHRDVQGRGRLIQQHDLRFDDQRAGDGDALPLAARELVWVTESERGIETHPRERLADPAVDRIQAVDPGGLAEDPVDGMTRVQ